MSEKNMRGGTEYVNVGLSKVAEIAFKNVITSRDI